MRAAAAVGSAEALRIVRTPASRFVYPNRDSRWRRSMDASNEASRTTQLERASIGAVRVRPGIFARNSTGSETRRISASGAKRKKARLAIANDTGIERAATAASAAAEAEAPSFRRASA